MFLLLWLGASGVALAWLPPALRTLALLPLAPACLLALGWYVLAIRSGPRKAPTTALAAVTVLGLFVALVELPEKGQALPPEQPSGHTVFVLPGPLEQPEKQSVLVTPELLEQLREQTQTPSGVVLLSAVYTGKIVDGAAEFDATYQAYCLSKDAASLAIPLDGVRLVDDVWLDGARVFPSAVPPPQFGYSLKLTGLGAHKIELRFRVAVTGTGEDRDLQFTAPRLSRNRLRLDLSPSASFVQSISARGAETLAASATAKTYEVDLGRLAGPVQVHWFQETLPPRPVRVRFREAYCWDLRSDASSLTGLIHFEVTQGNATTLDVNLPPDLEVRGVEVKRPGTEEIISLQNWRVRTGTGSERSYAAAFPKPDSRRCPRRPGTRADDAAQGGRGSAAAGAARNTNAGRRFSGLSCARVGGAALGDAALAAN